MTPEQQAALDEYLAATQAYAGQTYGQLTPAEIQETALAGVQYDPKMLEYEMSALRALEEQGREGLTAQDRAAIAAAERQAGQAARGRRGAIEQGMRSRGISGSGLDLVAQLQSAESANELAAMKALEQGALSSQRRTQGQLQAGQMAGQIGTRQYQTAAERAAAQDRIRQFNAQNRMGAQQFNIQSAQQQAANKLGAQQSAARMKYDTAVEAERARLMREDERKRRRAGGLTAGLGVLGAGLGAYASAGSPQGATLGYTIGSGLGQAFSGYADGGLVDPYVFSPPSPTDSVPALLTPGERVLPRDVANSPDAAAAFVEAQKKAEADVLRAKEQRDLLQYGDIGAKLLSDYAASQKRNVYLPRGLNELGKGPEVFTPKTAEYQAGTLTKLGDIGVQRAQEGLGAARQKFADIQGVEKYKKAREFDDPNSDISKRTNLLLKSKLSSVRSTARGMNDMETAKLIDEFSKNQNMSANEAMQALKLIENIDYKDLGSMLVKRKEDELKSQLTSAQIKKYEAEAGKLESETMRGGTQALSDVSAVPKELRPKYLEEKSTKESFQKAQDSVGPIVEAMGNITLQEGKLPGVLGGKKATYEAMKARVAAELIEKIPGIRSDADFRNIIEPQLPLPSDPPEEAAYKVKQFKAWLKSKTPASPISDVYLQPTAPVGKGASGDWTGTDYESLSDEELTKLYNQKVGGK